MPDVFSKRKRSEVMARIRGHGNKDTEIAMIRVLRKGGITGWRRRHPVFGKPDFVFLNFHAAIFVDGCFWHTCPKHATQPRNNAAFWRNKLADNRNRDRLVTRTLRLTGWRVLRIWEHEVSSKNASHLTSRIQRFLAMAAAGR